MNLPDPQLLQDAEWQLAHATKKLTDALPILRKVVATQPKSPAFREPHEAYCLLYKNLQTYCARAEALIELLGQREAEMNQEMGEARFRYSQMGHELDYWKAEAHAQRRRYYAEVDKLPGTFSSVFSAENNDQAPL